MRSSRLYVYAAFLVALVGLRVAISEVPKFSFWIGLDFYTAYGAAHALSVGDSPYDPIAIDDFARGEHLPRIGGDILGATPFWVWANQALLPLQARTAAWIWFLLSSLALLGGLALTETLIREAHPPTEPRHLRRLRVAMFVFLPNWGAVFIGQSTSLVLLLWVVAGLLVVRRAPVAAASVYALAGAIKVFPAGMLVWFILRRQWRAFACGLLVLVALQLPAIAARPDIIGEFIRAATQFAVQVQGNAALAANQSLLAFALRLMVENPWSAGVAPPRMTGLLLAAFTLGLLVPTAVAAVRRPLIDRLEHLATLEAMTVVVSICAPFLWHHSYVVLWPAYALLLLVHPRLGILNVTLVAMQHVWDVVHPSWLLYLPPLSSTALASALLCWAMLLRGRRREGLLAPRTRRGCRGC